MSYYADGNFLSLLAFFFWIPTTFVVMWRWPAAKATAVLFLGGLLLLPERVFFKPLGLPEFAKLEIVPLWIVIFGLMFHRERFASAPKSGWVRLLIAVLLIGAVATVFLNTDGYFIGVREFPGHRPWDAVHAMLNSLMSVVLPFYVGAVMFRTSNDLRTLLKVFVVAAVLYTPLQYLEMLLSPQLHRWIYGFHQHNFLAVMRGEGYRPMVFMTNGLALALFTMMAVTAAAGLYKCRIKVFRLPSSLVGLYLWGTLLISKSLAALLYTFVSVPLVLFTSLRLQTLIALAFVGALFVYPIARANDLIPVEELEAWAIDNYGEERADSLMFRLNNETPLVERAMERRWFGWGSYCRACIFKEWSDFGSPETIRDGAWIIRLGDQGIVGYVGSFGFLLFALLALMRRAPYIRSASSRRLLGTLALMIGFSAFDFIPNGDFNHLAFLMSGALWGCSTGILLERAYIPPPPEPEPEATGVALAHRPV